MNNDDLDAFLEEKSLYWNDDKDMVDTFVLKTIKRFEPDEQGRAGTCFRNIRMWRTVTLPASSSVLPSSTAMLISTISSDASRNWDFSRLAYMDVVIMQIAIAELINFPRYSCYRHHQ